ncbi:MAG: SlyX family protein [Alphaproteobacteria bacterium]|nr:SlyX family protein [Alphaproteobacteria bacterium]
MSTENRLTNIELILTEQQRMLDDLNDVVIRYTKELDALKKQCAYIKTMLERDSIKPLSEETPPPHY